MPYDEKLAQRIRELLPADTPYSEKKMFGGLAFLANGNMCITVSGQGGVLARVGPEKYKELSSASGVEVAVMRGKTMKGWLRVPSEKLRTKKQLERWFNHCHSFTSSLPSK